MRLLEIVRGQASSPHALATALGFAKRLSKVGVVVGNSAGFVGNRLMFPYMYEAQFLLEEWATPEQVDQALQNFGMAMGIFAVEDMAGLDVAWRVRRELRQFSAPGQRKPLVVDALCEMRRFGQKSGKGWYTSVDLKHIHERISSFEREFGPRWKVSPLLQTLAEHGKTFRSFDEEHRASGEQG
jgi:3-hydroxyacyl-CoA dehydrogenase